MPPATASPSVSADGICVRYGRGTRWSPAVDALVDVDIRCGAGEIVGVLGPNGSGKTTLFRTICGDLSPRAGRVTVLGHRPGDPALVTRVGFQPDGPVPFPHFRARVLLRHFGALMRLPGPIARERADARIDELRLTDVADRRVRALSTGMQKRLALAAALLADPDVLLLDEPTSGLDPFGSRVVLGVLRDRAARGAAILLASHRLDEVEEVCDRVVLLHRGRKVTEGTLDDLLGTGVEALELDEVDGAARAQIEAAARAAGARVGGWTRRRRHPFELFRELEEES